MASARFGWKRRITCGRSRSASASCCREDCRSPFGRWWASWGFPRNSRFPTRSPGDHGGNLDCPDVRPGNTLWLPVFVPGANVSIGDAHAAMGDGEVSGTGVETEASVNLTVTLHKGRPLDGPVVTTPEKTVFLSSGPTLEGAIRKALDRAIETLALRRHLCEKDAYIVASVSGNIRVCQVVNGDVTVGYEVPREVLPW